ncbi:ferredoxin [Nocardia vermiculata]|uniref:Ferredoxin n=1 Tax=Nocardia vermiculata TaxID=257274 RepID=A0A846XPM8_9NOCA|nr:ferredoxin [Nocardia vermiculata]NKY49003.1 ferredoxin [Nocardia vermiculata]
MRVSVDSDRCAGHGVCVAFCPEVFELTDHGYARAHAAAVPAAHERAAAEAISACPEGAISQE